MFYNLLLRTTREDANCDGLRSKIRGKAASSTTYSDMRERALTSTEKRYVDHQKYRSKLTCLIHGPGNLTDECKVLGDFVSKYSKVRTTKDIGHEPASMKYYHTANEQ